MSERTYTHAELVALLRRIIDGMGNEYNDADPDNIVRYEFKKLGVEL